MLLASRGVRNFFDSFNGLNDDAVLLFNALPQRFIETVKAVEKIANPSRSDNFSAIREHALMHLANTNASLVAIGYR